MKEPCTDRELVETSLALGKLVMADHERYNASQEARDTLRRHMDYWTALLAILEDEQ